MKYIVWLVVGVFSFAVLSPSIVAAEWIVPYTCGIDKIVGKVESSDPANTLVTLSLSQWTETILSLDAVVFDDGSYEAPFTEELLPAGEYLITSTATLGELTDTWTYVATIRYDCPPPVEEHAVAPVLTEEQYDKILAYAQEVALFKARHQAYREPPRFVASGWPFAFVDTIISSLWARFAKTSSATYHDLPSWTLDPEDDTGEVWFHDLYVVIPNELQQAPAYLRFKWLFVPVSLSSSTADEKTVLSLLNKWGVLAPETRNFDVLGAVKMLYMHALSFSKSPFAGIGSYLSVYADPGDEVTVYVKTSGSLYEQRTYTILSSLQVDPDETGVLKQFSKEWADAYAFITCRDGDVLGSTAKREIILAQRKKQELWSFHQTVLNIHDAPSLAVARGKIDAFLRDKEFDEASIGRLVDKIEEVEQSVEWTPMKTILTYGKYMAAYDAVYNDGVFEGL